MWLMFFLGFIAGIVVVCLWSTLVVAGRADDLEEKWRQQ